MGRVAPGEDPRTAGGKPSGVVGQTRRQGKRNHQQSRARHQSSQGPKRDKIRGGNLGEEAKPSAVQGKSSTSNDKPSTQKRKLYSDTEEPSLTESESSSHNSNSDSNTEKPSTPPNPKASGAGTDKPNYFWLKTTMKNTEPNGPTENIMVTQFQQGQECHRPNETTPGLQTARDTVVKILNGWEKGMPETNKNKDFETFAVQNMVRIMKSTAILLKNTEQEALSPCLSTISYTEETKALD